MKHDMAGGAAVLGAAEALAQIQPEGVEVRAWRRLSAWPKFQIRDVRLFAHSLLPVLQGSVDASINAPPCWLPLWSLQYSRVRKAQFQVRRPVLLEAQRRSLGGLLLALTLPSGSPSPLQA